MHCVIKKSVRTLLLLYKFPFEFVSSSFSLRGCCYAPRTNVVLWCIIHGALTPSLHRKCGKKKRLYNPSLLFNKKHISLRAELMVTQCEKLGKNLRKHLLVQTNLSLSNKIFNYYLILISVKRGNESEGWNKFYYNCNVPMFTRKSSMSKSVKHHRWRLFEIIPAGLILRNNMYDAPFSRL